MKLYTFYSDSSHGWLKVSRQELIDFGLINEISSYSYQSKTGQSVYLEEDSDAVKFITALENNGLPFKYTEKIFNKSLTSRWNNFKKQCKFCLNTKLAQYDNKKCVYCK